MLFGVELVEGFGHGFDEVADFVAHADVVAHGFVVGHGHFGEARGIVEGFVDDFGFAGEDGAGFLGVVAHGDYVVELDVAETLDGLGAVLRDIDAGHAHDFDGDAVESVGFGSGGVGFEGIGFEVAGPAFGHLTSAGISRAEEEDFDAWIWWIGLCV